MRKGEGIKGREREIEIERTRESKRNEDKYRGREKEEEISMLIYTETYDGLKIGIKNEDKSSPTKVLERSTTHSSNAD